MKPKGHIFIPKSKLGVLMVNLGTPEKTDYVSMWSYLREFLSDKRIIEVSRFIWFPILYLIILIFRPRKSGRLYDKIWDMKKNQSPLKVYTKKIAEKLNKIYKNKNTIVTFAMNYGYPKIKVEMDKLKNKGCERILIFPMYPQYSATTVASVVDKVFDYLKIKRWQPTIRIVPPYYDDENYISALMESIDKEIKKSKKKLTTILCSFHGIPKKYFFKGDPYHCHCAKTVRLLNEKFKKKKVNFDMSFQSRFGPQEWLKPYMNEKMDEILSHGKTQLTIIAPGFSVDCLETLEEIKIQGEEDFIEKGGKDFYYIECLNDSKAAIKMYKNIINRELKGWLN